MRRLGGDRPSGDAERGHAGGVVIGARKDLPLRVGAEVIVVRAEDDAPLARAGENPDDVAQGNRTPPRSGRQADRIGDFRTPWLDRLIPTAILPARSSPASANVAVISTAFDSRFHDAACCGVSRSDDLTEFALNAPAQWKGASPTINISP
jgi:hypothetical protein